MASKLYHVTLTHKSMVLAESPEHAESLLRSHLQDLDTLDFHQEIRDFAEFSARQTHVTNENDLVPGFEDAPPWGGEGSKTCGDIIKEAREAREAKPKED
jgi:hypothetical protein